MRIDLPEPYFESNFSSDHSHSDWEDTQEEPTTAEDMQSLVGVSISRTQTRLKSPTTPAAQKAAALVNHGGDAFFDSNPPAEHAQRSHRQTPPERPNFQVEDSGLNASPINTTLPTPWTSGPKLFEQHPAQDREQEARKPRQRANTGTMGTLADLNIKRFISSFAMPSIPKPPNLRDVQMPALSFLMGGNVETPTPGVDHRHKRANSDTSQISQHWPRRLDSLLPLKANDLHILGQVRKSSLQKGSSQPGAILPNAKIDNGVRQPSLKRAASDQSLILRRPTSMTSSLGDDSRWEHVQKQVNSRAKAISDTLQDTSIRLPSLPSLPNVNLGILRGKPDFLRNRAASDTARPLNRLETKDKDLAITSLIPLGNQRQVRQESLHSEKAVDSNADSVIKSQKSLQPNLDKALESLTGDIVILGGYRGSILRSAKPPHRQLWVPVKVGLNIRRVNLEVGLDPEDEERMEETIIPSGMLSHIGPIDMGRRLLKRLRSCTNAQEGRLRVHDYGYDWRLSPHLLSRRLVQYLKQLPANCTARRDDERGAIVIAHSLGGLITRHAVNQCPELFAGVIYAGVPQHCVNILGPLRNGDEVLLSSKVLTAQVNFTLRTSFLLLPADGRCFIDKVTKEEYAVDFFDPGEWKRYALSPCIAASLPPSITPERKGLLSFVTDNMPSFNLIDRKSVADSKESTQDRESTRTGPKGPIVPAMADINPSLDSQSFSSGPSDAPRSTIPLPKAENYLIRTLADTVRFKAELKFIPQYAEWNIYPPLSVLYGTSVPTVSRARVSCRDAIKCVDAYDDLAFASGDGVCLARAAMLPEGYKCVTDGKVKTERGHVGLLGDLEAVGKCLLSVLAGRRSGTGLGPLHCGITDGRKHGHACT